MAPDELAGLAEVAFLFGVTKRTAYKYTRLPHFPEPLVRLASGPVWRRREVEVWGKTYLPLPRTGRPPKAPD